MRFTVDVSMLDGADPIVVADHLLDVLCEFTDPAMLDSIDGVDPVRE